jgi:hypothetical protein
MKSISRTITTAIIDWRGLLVKVTYERQQFAAHIQIESVEPIRAPLPISETGYRTQFVSGDAVADAGGPEFYVSDWLDEAARDRGWVEQEAAIRQYALF